jgi:O-antigen/teichoic acid export membrane protein
VAQSANARLFAHGAYSLADRISMVFFGFLNVFFMARMMPKSELGIWVLFTSVTAILEMIRVGFIRNPFITHLVSAEEAEKKTIVTASFVLHCTLSVIISLVIIFGAAPLADFWSAPLLAKLFFIYAINNLIFIPYHHFEYLQQAQLKFKGIFISNVFRLGILAVYIIVKFFMNDSPTLVELAIVQGIATFIGCFVAYYFVRGTIQYSRIVEWKLIKELFHYGKFTLGTNISSMFVKNTDTWMIGRIVSTAGVAIYNPAVRLSNLVEVPTLAIAGVFFPQVAQKLKEQGEKGVRDIYIKSVSLILALTIPMVLPLYIFAELAIVLIFGREYIEAAAILRVTLFYTLIIPFNRQFGTVMDGTKRPKINFYLLVLVAVLNVAFNLIFLYQFGVIGSAFATLVSYTIVFTLNQIILYRMFGVNTLHVFTEIIEWYKMGWSVFCKKVLKMKPVL